MGYVESPRPRGWSDRVGPTGKAARQPSLGSNGSQGGKRKSTYTGPETEEERARRRAKNRIAARESRARKVQCIMSLQADIAALQDANTMLRSRIDEITAKAEVAQQQHQMMREQIFIIRATRTQEDQMIIDDLLGGMHTPEACGGVRILDEPSISDMSPQRRADAAADADSCQASLMPELRLNDVQVPSADLHGNGHIPSPPQLIGSPFHPLHVAADEAFLGIQFQ